MGRLLEDALKEEQSHPRGGVGRYSMTQLRKKYSDEALEEMLKNKTEENHDGDRPTPLDSGYSGPD